MATTIPVLLIRTIVEQMIILQAARLFISLISTPASCKVFHIPRALQREPDQEGTMVQAKGMSWPLDAVWEADGICLFTWLLTGVTCSSYFLCLEAEK